MSERENWKEKYRLEHLRSSDERIRLLSKIGKLQRHNETLLEIIERLMDSNRRFRD